MNGLDWLKKVRKKRLKPPYVAISDRPYDETFTPEYLEPTSGDCPSTGDWRIFYGLFVVVDSQDPAFVEKWARAVLKAKADTVLGMVWKIDKHGDIHAKHTTYRLYGIDQ